MDDDRGREGKRERERDPRGKTGMVSLTFHENCYRSQTCSLFLACIWCLGNTKLIVTAWRGHSPLWLITPPRPPAPTSLHSLTSLMTSLSKPQLTSWWPSTNQKKVPPTMFCRQLMICFDFTHGHGHSILLYLQEVLDCLFFYLLQVRNHLEMNRWRVPCWPLSWTLSWMVTPFSTGTPRATSPGSSWPCFPEELATRWDIRIIGSQFNHRHISHQASRLLCDPVSSLCSFQEGGVESGFRRTQGSGTVHRLYQIKGKRNIRAKEVEMSWCSFNKGDCFILDLGEVKEVTSYWSCPYDLISVFNFHLLLLFSRQLCHGLDLKPTSLRSVKCVRSPRLFVTLTDTEKPESWTPMRGRSLRRCSRWWETPEDGWSQHEFKSFILKTLKEQQRFSVNFQ